MHKIGSEFLYKNASEKFYYKWFEINDAKRNENIRNLRVNISTI